jgi:lipopolysaccharide export system permease protein
MVVISIIVLNTTPLSYAEEEKDKILNGTFFKETKSNIFLKYGDSFVFFKQLYPLRKEAREIFIFKTNNNNDVLEITNSKRGFYQNNKWYFIQTVKTIKPTSITQASKLSVYKSDSSYGLDNFEPNVIKNIDTTKTKLSTFDALYAILFFGKQNLDTNVLRANLYNQVISYFYVFPLISILFLFTNPSKRFFNANVYVMLSIFTTLGVWGGYFLLQRLAVGDLLNAELAIILPIIILYIKYFYIKQFTT